jgi:hypothetical protein
MNTLQFSDSESVTKIEINDLGGLEIAQILLCDNTEYDFTYLEKDEVKALYRFLKDYYENHI